MFAISLPDLIPDIDVVGMVEGVLKKAVEVLFGDPLSELGGEVLRVLLVYPDLATSEEFAELREAVAQLRTPALLLLAAFTLMGFVRGLGVDGSDGGIDVLRRFFVGFFGIWFWSYLFSKGIAGANLFLEGMVDLPAVEETISAGLTTSFAAGGPLGLLFAPLLGVLAIVLLGVKIAMTALLALVYGLGTLAFAAYPFEPLAHLTGTLFQTLGACLALPAVWMVELVVFAGVGKGALVFSGADLAEELTAPLVAATLLVMMIMTPFALLRWASMRGLLPTLQGGLSAAYYGSQMGRMIGVTAIGGQASGLLAQAAAPPPPGGAGPAAAAPSMGFDPPPRGPNAGSGFVAGELASGDGSGGRDSAAGSAAASRGAGSAGEAPGTASLWSESQDPTGAAGSSSTGGVRIPEATTNPDGGGDLAAGHRSGAAMPSGSESPPAGGARPLEATPAAGPGSDLAAPAVKERAAGGATGDAVAAPSDGAATPGTGSPLGDSTVAPPAGGSALGDAAGPVVPVHGTSAADSSRAAPAPSSAPAPAEASALARAEDAPVDPGPSPVVDLVTPVPESKEPS